METSDLTVRILTDIRDELRTTRAELRDELRTTNERIAQTNTRLDQMRQQAVESEIRLATAITDMAGTLHDVRDLLVARALEARVEKCERDITDLQSRLP
jgi:phage shock protein A